MITRNPYKVSSREVILKRNEWLLAAGLFRSKIIDKQEYDEIKQLYLDTYFIYIHY